MQDNKRELAMMELFELKAPPGKTRGGVDAILELGKSSIRFELKSTTTGSVTTVRDFGPAHITAWEGKHWLIGLYSKKQELKSAVYASPAQMKPWIDEKRKYIEADFRLAEIAPGRLVLDDLYNLLGKKSVYTYADARFLQKRQYSRSQYNALMDVGSGYSPNRMLDILLARCRYLVERGSTLNNPHIPKGFVAKLPHHIKENFAERLRVLVAEEIASD